MKSNSFQTLQRRIKYFIFVVLRNHSFSYCIVKGKSDCKNPKIVGMIRLKNEALILQDTLDHLSQFVDCILIFDDASNDESVVIARNHPGVAEIIVNKRWKKNRRIWEETANRKLLYKRARRYRPQWFFYADADERFEGDIRKYLLEECPANVNAVRVSLFDAYITKNDKNAYRKGQQLYNFRKYFGIEQRDILMMWRNIKNIDFLVPDAREPQRVAGDIITKFFCQHYGKSISIEQWEETCAYYAENFPKYSEKWRARMGKAVHENSDFDTKLFLWDDVKSRGKKI